MISLVKDLSIFLNTQKGQILDLKVQIYELMQLEGIPGRDVQLCP